MPAMLLHIHSLRPRDNSVQAPPRSFPDTEKVPDHTDSPRPEDLVQQRDRSCSFHTEIKKTETAKNGHLIEVTVFCVHSLLY